MWKNVLVKFTIFFIIFHILSASISSTINANETIKITNDSFSEKQIDEVAQINISFKSGDYDLYGEIYYPSNNATLYPAIVFCGGVASYVSAYTWLAKNFAQEGYIVLIFDPPGLGKSEGYFQKYINFSISSLNLFFRFGSIAETLFHYIDRDWEYAVSDALTYFLTDSPVKHLIDPDHIGLIGHSLGGITITEVVANDKRFDTLITLSFGNTLRGRDIDIPVQLICGDIDMMPLCVLSSLSCYEFARPPKELIVIQGGTHFGFTSAFKEFCPCPPWQKDIIERYTVGWFNYILKNQTSAYEIITTGTDHLSELFKSRYTFGEGEHILEE